MLERGLAGTDASTDGGTPAEHVPGFKEVFEAELRASVAVRRKVLVDRRALPGAMLLDSERLHADEAFGLDLAGLSLSGGGIRSAAFNLGLLQALAHRDALKRFDYLSTVSGGGYIGACLTSLLSGGNAGVTAADFPFRREGPDERAEIKHLRQHGEYLAPRHGPLRLDTWRLVASYLLGLTLTLATVITILGALAALGIWLYPRVFIAIGLVEAADLLPGHDLWGHPWDHLLVLFSPALLAAAAWCLAGAFYVILSIWEWTLRSREVTTRLLGATLLATLVLAALGAAPLLLAGLAQQRFGSVAFSRRAIGWPAWGAFGLSALSTLWSDVLSRRPAGRGARLGRGAVLAGVWTFMLLFCFAILYAVHHNRPHALPIAGGCLALLVVLAVVSDINRISMFYFYRDRLSEAFVFVRDDLERDPIRGNDGLKLSAVASHLAGGPYHLINATVNLPGSETLDLRGRRADFFLLSPFYCGSRVTGYVRTRDFETDRLNLASAMAVSGAATNPQYGSRTNPALAFLLALLNVRLGVWTHNPRYPYRPSRWLRQAMKFWPWYFLKELLSLADQRSRFVGLSDGGHIENLGAYELLRRRCRLIVASDAGADPSCVFEDLGNLLRKARIDLGVRIDVDPRSLAPRGWRGLSGAHAVRGTIRYATPDAAGQEGVLIYVKSALVEGDVPDLHEYRRGHPSFPHEATSDQFFDEAQFESYRELGYQSGKAALALLEAST